MRAHVSRRSFFPTDKSKKNKTKQSNDHFQCLRPVISFILHTSITVHSFRHERGRHLTVSLRYCSRFLLQADSCHFCRNMKIYVSMAMSSAKHVESQWREGILNNTEQRTVSTELLPVHTVVGRFSKATWR